MSGEVRGIGFVPRNEALHRAYNVLVALFVLSFALPAITVISVALFMTQGRNIFYKGPRLGKDLRVFNIYKFCTLQPGLAASMTATGTLPINSGIETPLGAVLRRTRLDELPQILNVLRGDMNVCGPRPVRPEIAQIERSRIENYDVRFSVKPGLVGPAQVFMSHGASKKIRARYNNSICKKPICYRSEVALVATVSWTVVRETSVALFRAISRAGQGSRVSRTSLREIWLRLEDGKNCTIRVITLGQRTIVAPEVVRFDGERRGMLILRLRNGGIRTARIMILASEKNGVFHYTAISEAAEYVIERYGLRLAFVSPDLRTVPVEMLIPNSIRRALDQVDDIAREENRSGRKSADRVAI